MRVGNTQRTLQLVLVFHNLFYFTIRPSHANPVTVVITIHSRAPRRLFNSRVTTDAAFATLFGRTENKTRSMPFTTWYRVFADCEGIKVSVACWATYGQTVDLRCT